MAARYLVRFDDICPQMDWVPWGRIEEILDMAGIRPIVAVIPDNRDEKLNVGQPAADFWFRVRRWQEKGWTIGWHGHQHAYTSKSGGIVGIHAGSEFAGIPESIQREKLGAAARIFENERVLPAVWVAPGHSFDRTTLRLLPEFGIKVISDGLFFRMITSGRCTWIPQQLWRFRAMPFGLWTVCYHTNGWGSYELDRFEAEVRRFRESITAVEFLLHEVALPLAPIDAVFQAFYRRLVLAKARRRRDPAIH